METRCKCCGGKIRQSEAATMTYCKVCCKRFNIKTTNNERMFENIKSLEKSNRYTPIQRMGRRCCMSFKIISQ